MLAVKKKKKNVQLDSDFLFTVIKAYGSFAWRIGCSKSLLLL